MARLFTNHDPYHIHKTLGLFALMNFLLRFYYVARYGNSFPPEAGESKGFQCLCVLVHAALPAMSMFLPLPPKRNFWMPMIWPEFRLHSILFSCRHVLCTLLTILELWPTQIWGSTFGVALAECACKLAVVIGTVQLASLITDHYGDREKRTTNAMPYPPGVKEEEQKLIKCHYARKQFGATIMACVCGPLSATFSFAPIYAIQAAPFMMTLVRKGKCEALAYHRVYSCALMYPVYMYYLLIRREFKLELVDIVFGLLYMATFRLRMNCGWDNRKMWALMIPLIVLTWLYVPSIEALYIIPKTPPTLYAGFLYAACFYVLRDQLMTHYKVYKPFWRTQQPQTSEDKAMSELQQSIKDAYDKADERGEVYDHAEVHQSLGAIGSQKMQSMQQNNGSPDKGAVSTATADGNGSPLSTAGMAENLAKD